MEPRPRASSDDSEDARCNSHGQVVSRSPCERCGAFLCMDCVWNSKFRALCASCYALSAEKELPRIKPPMDLRSAFANHLNLAIGAGLFFGTLFQLLLSSKFGYRFALGVYVFSILLVPIAALSLFPFRWLWLFLVNPLRRQRVIDFEKKCFAVLRETLRESRARDAKQKPGLCLLCQSNQSSAEGICTSCSKRLYELIHELGITRPATINGPPWTPSTRKNLIVLLVWTQILSLTFFLLPGPFVLLCLEYSTLSVAVLVVATALIFYLFGDAAALLDSDRVAPGTSDKPAPLASFAEAFRSTLAREAAESK